MQLKRLELKNCLGIKEIEYTPGKINVISGGNEKGKTSILESIEKALYNTERRPKFVTDGAGESTLYVEIDNGISIDRRIKEDGSSKVKVTQSGAMVNKPETVLKSLVGDFAFNPVDFMNKRDKEQTEILLSLIPMRITETDLMEWFGEIPPVNLNQHALQVLTYLAEKWYYDKRSIANGEVKECMAEIDAIKNQLPDNYDAEDWRNVVIADLWKSVDDAKKVNNYIDLGQQIIDDEDVTKQNINNKFNLQIKEQDELLEFKKDRAKKSVEERKQDIKIQIEANNVEIEAYKEKIRQLEQSNLLKEQELQSIDETVVAVKNESLTNERNIAVKAIEEKREIELQAADEKINKARKYLEENEITELKPLEDKANEAEAMKGYIALYDNMKKLQETLKVRNENASKLDDFVKLARRKPAELLATIQMPVKGLGIDENGCITIDGLPIKNLSTGRQMRLAMEIARATAGELKLICVDRWESLDEDQRKIFIEEAVSDGFQYFITEVTNGDLAIERVS
ncbi:hypothetical protein [Anaerosolibacter sp.]|uniref:hypothetical protein n=1 Tax=Anaerosolibacter sp. TaxID=1872527 RepID=UPI0039EED7B2